ncbi:MAG TPA: hypothetical protein DCM05_02800 [Elusimicrobia bacterium]|nr:hypothetical protein [Elusimicrobiota bacterium]
MPAIPTDPGLVAYCGLYCGACRSYLKGRCPGCHANVKASWCKVRSCCIERKYSTCADCRDFPYPKECRRFHNFISKLIGFLLRSDRAACIAQIKRLGLQGHAAQMACCGRHSLRP